MFLLINNDLEAAHPRSGSSFTYFPLELELEMFFRGKPGYAENISRSKGENQQQTLPTYGVDAGI